MFFMSKKTISCKLGTKQKCVLCGQQINFRFNPMKEWGIDGTLCGDCYSKKINEFYPGSHVRINKEQ